MGGIIAVVIAMAIAVLLKAEENSNEANTYDFVHSVRDRKLHPVIGRGVQLEFPSREDKVSRISAAVYKTREEFDV